MPDSTSQVVRGYSRIAERYDFDGNRRSFWSQLGEEAVESISPGPYATVVDVGCGTGALLVRLAQRFSGRVVGIEPAEGMRGRALQATRGLSNTEVVEGSFERLPLASGSVDYLFSMWAFHWTTDLERSVAEIERVLAPGGQVDLTFVGAQTGRDFEQAIHPVYQRFMGLRERVASAGLTKRLDRTTVERIFSRLPVDIDEWHRTFDDTVEGHLAWRVRLEGHFHAIPPEQRPALDRQMRSAIGGLATNGLVPYTLHAFRVRSRDPGGGPSAHMAARSTWNEVLARSSGEERLAGARDLVREAFLAVMRQDQTTHVDPRADFFELGLDSMRAAQLAARIESELGSSVPEVLVLSRPTVKELAEYLVQHLSTAGRVEAEQPGAGCDRPLHVLTLSAHDSVALAGQVVRVRSHVAGQPDEAFADVCHQAATTGPHLSHRVGVVAGSRDEAISLLNRVTSPSPASLHPQVAFIFSGEGGQHAGMGRTLFDTQPVFRTALQQCAAILRPLLDQPLLSVLYPESHPFVIDETRYTQPALFSLEYALLQLWRSWGIEPFVTLGHSLGEYLAAHAAGVFSLQDALRLVAERGRSMQHLGPLGSKANQTQALEAFAQVARGVRYSAPTRPFISTLSGQFAAAEVATPDYWVNSMRGTLRFVEGLQLLVSTGINIFLEVGPQSTLVSAGLPCPDGAGLASLQRGKDEWQTMLESLVQLYQRGVLVDWASFDRPYGRRQVAVTLDDRKVPFQS